MSPIVGWAVFSWMVGKTFASFKVGIVWFLVGISIMTFAYN